MFKMFGQLFTMITAFLQSGENIGLAAVAASNAVKGMAVAYEQEQSVEHQMRLDKLRAKAAVKIKQIEAAA